MAKYLGHKPCPKCGSDDLEVYKIERSWDSDKLYWIKYKDCGYELDGFCESREQAWKMWDEIEREEDFKDCEVVKESKHYRYSIKAEKLFDGSFYKRLKITDLRGSMIYEIVIDRNEMLVLAELIREIDDMPDNVFRCECGCPVLKVKKVFVGEYSNYTVECSKCGKEYFIDGKYKWIGNVFVKRG